MRSLCLWILLSLATIECAEEPLVFSIDHWIQVTDGTSVAPFFNPKDCTSNLPWDLVDHLSIAAGEIVKESTIQTLPLVTQITYVLSGTLEVVIKGSERSEPVTLTVTANQAVLMKPGSLFQLRNAGDQACRVLYIVSPAYLFEMDASGGILYDDAFIVLEGWDELTKQDWKPRGLPSLEELKTAREESYARMKVRKK
jgi:mannose-6-phosphate isomerase-like protein (cupin superfamily)